MTYYKLWCFNGHLNLCLYTPILQVRDTEEKVTDAIAYNIKVLEKAENIQSTYPKVGK